MARTDAIATLSGSSAPEPDPLRMPGVPDRPPRQPLESPESHEVAAATETGTVAQAVLEEATPQAETSPTLAREPGGDSLLQWTGFVVTVVGVILALFAAFLFLYTPFQASRAQHHLLSELRPPTGSKVLTGYIPLEGNAVALLEIPALHLDQVVVEGTSARDLTEGPGLMPGSALPGTPGNTVIAGRRYLYGKPFASIGSLKPGDAIKIVSAYGIFDYQVTGTHDVSPGGSDPIAPTADNRLTLVTSNASLAPSSRVVAIARLDGFAVNVHVSAIRVPPTSERALSGDGGSLVPAIVFGILLGGGIVVTTRLYRRWHQRWPTYLMTTPVLIVFAILFFQDLARLLPATL